MRFDKAIISPVTVDQMVDAHQKASQEIEEAYRLLEDAKRRLTQAFGSEAYFTVLPRRYSSDPAEEVKLEVKKTAWSSIIGRLNLQKIASTKRIDEMHRILENGKDLPDLTAAIIFELLTSLQQNKDEIFKELASEVFEYLRPPRSNYKTNSKFEIGPKVILTWAVEKSFSYWKVRFGSAENRLTAIDKLFHLLDGKGVPEGYRTPLADAISTTTTGEGETEYFAFKCYQNGNLHLQFKRLDLLRSLNAMCGGATLRDGAQKQHKQASF